MANQQEQDNGDTVKDSRVPDVEQKDPLYSLKVGKTVYFAVTWISLGMLANISTPTIPDLRERLNVDMESISLALAFRALGIPVGSIVGGMIADRYRSKSDLIGSISMAVGGISAITIPFMGGLPGVGSMSFLGGLGHGGLDSVGHAAIQGMWAEKSSIPMHSLHLGYPIGATLAPIIAGPFLSSENETVGPTENPITTKVVDLLRKEISLSEPLLKETVTDSSETDEHDETTESRIEIPYGIIGGFSITLGIILLVFFIIGWSRKIYRQLYGRSKQSMKEVFSPQSFRALGDTSYTVILIVLICLFFAFAASKDSTMDTFIFSYAVDSELQFSKDEAAALSAAYNAAGILGRILCIAIAPFCPIEIFLISTTLATTAFCACVAFLGTEKDIYIWTFALLFKLTASPTWPCMIIWTAKYIKFSSLVIGFIQISASLATFASQWASGYLYDTYGPEAHVYYGMGCGFMMVVILAALQLIGSLCKDKGDAELVKEVIDQEQKEHGSSATLEQQFSTRL